MGDLIVRRAPYCQPRGAQRLVNQGYLTLARLAANLLARSPLVRSVFVRRSIAAGEARFPWSDIDLTLILHQHCAGPAQFGPLLDLNRKVRRLRRAFPLVGQIETFTADELPVWFLLEPARESLNRRSAILLACEPLSIPAIPIPPENAAYRFCFYLEDYVPHAVMTRNSRNLRKFALDMWSNAGVARGLFAEPHITRSAAAQARRT